MRARRLLPFCALLGVAACADVTGPKPGPEAWTTTSLDERLVHAYTSFGIAMFDELVTAQPDSNLFISPTSAAFALAMTYNGAAGGTQEAMARALGIEGMTEAEVNRANREWLATLVNTGPRVELSLANSIWIRQGLPVLPAFLDRNREFYGAEVAELDFSSPSAPATINDWVSKGTRGKIDRIIDSIDRDVMLYLINALYFKGEWTYRFDKAKTREEAFNAAGGATTRVPMMQQTITVPYLWGEGFQMVSLPYGSGRFSMVLVLPHGDSDLRAFYDRLDPANWEGWIERLHETEAAIVLPRFKMEWEESLKRTLTRLGMGVAFSAGGADFSRMSPVELFIGDVKQKTFVEVNEEGTEAAAVTVVEMRTTSTATPTLRFDRPFFFAIRDNATSTLLFMGQVVDPAQ